MFLSHILLVFLTKVSYKGKNAFKVKLPCSLKYSENEISCHLLIKERKILAQEKSQKKYSDKSFIFHFPSIDVENETGVADFVCSLKTVGFTLEKIDGVLSSTPLYENKYSESHRMRVTICDGNIKEVKLGFY